ncbi:MFS general substrate transporter [Hypoxylon trugodes]|uniref:MFS general substrate transporter n=1 Tax=Hypoxylon trugodes TaxID=326681 RepID=UPI00219AB8D3|nr:MFS general substrate transporter [Hypoxylon trugodes]KAI1391885.1 MFS general substrate transporter [Hypoxylon trugodes]
MVLGKVIETADQAVHGDEEAAPVNVDESTVADWTEAEERAVKRKLDFILLPILGLAFFALQMDRGNISNALTSTITKDLGVDTNQINAGNSLLSAGIVLLEIPSNILLQRIGPRNWLSGQIVAWGLVATFQNFITNYGGYLATRLLLGLCEAGFIPGSLYTMSTWYKKSESSLRISIFFLGNLIASATTSLIGAGILSMGDRYGVAGWRWLFIVEGAITIGVGIIFILFLPPKVGNGSPFISFGRWSYFNRRESYILVRRVLLDDPAKTTNHLRISGSDVWETVKNPRILVHIVITLTSTIPVNAINTYGPSVIKSLGYGTVRANAMASVGAFIAAIMTVLLAWVCDTTRKRAPSMLIGAIWSIIAFTCLREASSWTAGRKYAAVVFSMAMNSTIHILNVGWLSVNCQRPQQRSIAMAMIIMGANAGGIAGSQVFRTQDAPLYLNAFTACLVLSAVVAVEIIAQSTWYFISNKKLDKEGDGPIIVGKTDETPDGQKVELVRKWRWTW